MHGKRKQTTLDSGQWVNSGRGREHMSWFSPSMCDIVCSMSHMEGGANGWKTVSRLSRDDLF